jgi:hypothetical protein
MARFAACMRKHGVPDFPDPNSSGMFPLSSLEKLHPITPVLQAAFKTCQSLEPKVGPRLALP